MPKDIGQFFTVRPDMFLLLPLSSPGPEFTSTTNNFELLVSQEMFDNANAKILSREREDTSGNVPIFSGLIKCGTCGKAMCQRYWGRDRHCIFVCATYARDTKKCGDHRIFYDDLYDAVLAGFILNSVEKNAASMISVRLSDKSPTARQNNKLV